MHALFIIMEALYSAYSFRSPGNKNPAEKPIFSSHPEAGLEEPGKGQYLLCRQCRQIITSTAEIIEVSGSHQHTFANPEGILFEIGCFKKTLGCWYLEPAVEEFSWFKGFKWKVALCRRCLTHLGWLYVASDTASFHGLILNRLMHDTPARGPEA